MGELSAQVFQLHCCQASSPHTYLVICLIKAPLSLYFYCRALELILYPAYRLKSTGLDTSSGSPNNLQALCMATAELFKQYSSYPPKCNHLLSCTSSLTCQIYTSTLPTPDSAARPGFFCLLFFHLSIPVNAPVLVLRK